MLLHAGVGPIGSLCDGVREECVGLRVANVQMCAWFSRCLGCHELLLVRLRAPGVTHWSNFDGRVPKLRREQLFPPDAHSACRA